MSFHYTLFSSDPPVSDLLHLLCFRSQDLEHAQASDESHASFYFTKESHIHTFVNLVLASGLPMEKKKIPELDYGEFFLVCSSSVSFCSAPLIASFSSSLLQPLTSPLSSTSAQPEPTRRTTRSASRSLKELTRQPSSIRPSTRGIRSTFSLDESSLRESTSSLPYFELHPPDPLCLPFSSSHIPYEQVIKALKAFEGKAQALNMSFSTTPLEVRSAYLFSTFSNLGSDALLFPSVSSSLLQGEAIYFEREVKDEVVLPLSANLPSSSSSDRASDVGW